MKLDELQALQAFASNHGRRWKQALRDEWMRACSRLPETILKWSETPEEFDAEQIAYRGPLQRLRNDPDFGTRGLAKFRLSTNPIKGK